MATLSRLIDPSLALADRVERWPVDRLVPDAKNPCKNDTAYVGATWELLESERKSLLVGLAV